MCIFSKNTLYVVKEIENQGGVIASPSFAYRAPPLISMIVHHFFLLNLREILSYSTARLRQIIEWMIV